MNIFNDLQSIIFIGLSPYGAPFSPKTYFEEYKHRLRPHRVRLIYVALLRTGNAMNRKDRIRNADHAATHKGCLDR